MANNYFNVSGNPLTRSVSNSAQMRADLLAIQGAFDKLPNPYGGATKGFSYGDFNQPNISGGTINNASLSGTNSVEAKKFFTDDTQVYASPFAAFGNTPIFGFYSINNAGIVAGMGVGGAAHTSHQIAFDMYANCIFGDTANAKATNATDGFLMIPTCAGTPTGTPAHLYNSSVPFIYDSTNNKLCVYDGGWKQTAALT